MLPSPGQATSRQVSGNTCAQVALAILMIHKCRCEHTTADMLHVHHLDSSLFPRKATSHVESNPGQTSSLAHSNQVTCSQPSKTRLLSAVALHMHIEL